MSAASLNVPPTAHRNWLRTVRVSARLAALSATAGLVFWALMPMVLGWTPTVVVSGSMMPAIRPGDVVVVAALPTTPPARVDGLIVLAEDPAVPGSLLLHRVMGYAPDGALITKGDANHDTDRAAVPLANVHGAARLRVPYVGLPALWLRTGRGVPLLALASVLVVLGWPQGRNRLRATPAHAGPPTGRHRAQP